MHSLISLATNLMLSRAHPGSSRLLMYRLVCGTHVATESCLI